MTNLRTEAGVPRVWNKYDPSRPHNAVYVGRGSPWGNPFRISPAQNREQVIERFRCETLPMLDVTPLVGKDLVCYCAPKPCHADLLLEAANYAKPYLEEFNAAANDTERDARQGQEGDEGPDEGLRR